MLDIQTDSRILRIGRSIQRRCGVIPPAIMKTNVVKDLGMNRSFVFANGL